MGRCRTHNRITARFAFALLLLAQSRLLVSWCWHYSHSCNAMSPTVQYRKCSTSLQQCNSNSYWNRRYRVPNHIVQSPFDTTTTASASAALIKTVLLQSSRHANIDDKNCINHSTLQYHHLTNIERIFCLSDLHTDHVENQNWLKDQLKSSNLNSRDMVIIAGDISHEINTFQKSLDIIQNQCNVFFVPGNHEAWLSRYERTKFTTSLDKLAYLKTICQNRGVYVDPVYLDGVYPVWLLPLECWYDGTLSFDETLCKGFEKWPWVDFARCVWPFPPAALDSVNARIPIGLVEYFIARNRVNILDLWREKLLRDERENSDIRSAVVTVSHFASNQQCLPDWKDLSVNKFMTNQWLDHGAGTMSAKFAKVAGTALLDEQLRTLLPTSVTSSSYRHIHIFGHSHRPKDFDFEGIRYIHNPLGKPRERQLHMVSPDVEFQCIWNVNHGGEVKGERVIRYWEEKGGGKEMLWKRMEAVRPVRYQNQRQGNRKLS